MHQNPPRPNSPNLFSADRVMRVCSSCGFKDRSPVPPVMCPQCHFQDDSPLAQSAGRMNRHERRKQEASRRAQQRRVNKQLRRENPQGSYEAS